MCAVFGLLDFEGKLTPSERLMIFKALGKTAEVRGTDATGVAYVQNGSIQIQKAPKPAHKMRFASLQGQVFTSVFYVAVLQFEA